MATSNNFLFIKLDKTELTRIVKISAPILISVSLNAVLLFTDSLILSRYNEHALPASLSVGLILTFMMVFFSGTINYTGILIAKSYGEKKQKRILAYFVTSLIFACLSALVLFLVIHFFSVPILISFGHDEIQLQFSIECLSIIKFPPFFSMISACFTSLFNGLQHTDISMKVSLAVVAANIILDIVLINGIFIGNGLGIRGSALATIISKTIAILTYCTILFFRRDFIKALSTRILILARLKKAFSDLINKGSFVGLEHFFYLLCNTVAVNVMLGVDLLFSVTISIVFNVDRLAFLPFNALSIGAGIRVGNAIGEKATKSIPVILINTLVISLSIGSLIILCYLLVGPQLLNIFINESSDFEQIIQLGKQLLAITSIKVFFDALGMIYWGVLRGTGDTRAALIYSIISNIFRLIIIILFVRIDGLQHWVLWLAYCGLIGMLPFFGIVRFHRNRWRAQLTK